VLGTFCPPCTPRSTFILFILFRELYRPGPIIRDGALNLDSSPTLASRYRPAPVISELSSPAFTLESLTYGRVPRLLRFSLQFSARVPCRSSLSSASAPIVPRLLLLLRAPVLNSLPPSRLRFMIGSRTSSFFPFFLPSLFLPFPSAVSSIRRAADCATNTKLRPARFVLRWLARPHLVLVLHPSGIVAVFFPPSSLPTNTQSL